jgi:type IV fimbrial biogenesis protein FimT
MLKIRGARGLTLVEILVGLIVMSCLLLVGTPSFTRWIQEMQIRAAAESVQNGLQLARGEAVRRNRPVLFSLKNAGGMVEWEVGCKTASADCPAAIAARGSDDLGRNARAAATTDATEAADFGVAIAPGGGLPFEVEFNGLGNLATGSGGRIDISNAALLPSPRLTVIVGASGLIRLCDPTVSRSVKVQGCG